eukprot:5305877-Prymnesium_polylepis.2
MAAAHTRTVRACGGRKSGRGLAPGAVGGGAPRRIGPRRELHLLELVGVPHRRQRRQPAAQAAAAASHTAASFAAATDAAARAARAGLRRQWRRRHAVGRVGGAEAVVPARTPLVNALAHGGERHRRREQQHHRLGARRGGAPVGRTGARCRGLVWGGAHLEDGLVAVGLHLQLRAHALLHLLGVECV